MMWPFLLLMLSSLAHISQGPPAINPSTYPSPSLPYSLIPNVNLVIITPATWTWGSHLTTLALSSHMCGSLHHFKRGYYTGAAHQHRLILFLLLLTAGDIELNPGPSQHPCGYCDNPVNWYNRGVCCDNCSIWHHASCMGIGSKDYIRLDGSNVSWHCYKCNTTNLDSFTFHSYTLNDLSSNYYFPLTDQSISMKSTSPSTSGSPNTERTRHKSSVSTTSAFSPDPLKASTPRSRRNDTSKVSSNSNSSKTSNISSFSNSNSIPYNISKKQNLRVMTLNAHSIRNKTSEFNALLDYCKPDIVCCTETWLDGKKPGENPTTDWVKDSEVFPTNYKAFRNDRNLDGGGVFILIEKSLIAVEKPSFVTKCEMNWAKIHLKGRRELFIGCFYMPHRNAHDLQQLDLSLQEINKTKSRHVILCGDFNSP